jgi:O-antigen ligase
VDVLLVPFVAAALFVRVLTDHLSDTNSRHSGSLNLSGVIAVLFILVAASLLVARHRGVRAGALATLWLVIWTAIAINTSGASTETLREGVRELSVVALMIIVYSARDVMSVTVATRLAQLIGVVPAIMALYQLATHTGLDVSGNLRANGTFAHPNSAAMFFAIAAIASQWRYLDDGRHRSDALLLVLFAAALIATFSIDGLISLVAMLIVAGALHRGTFRVKAIPWVLAGVIVLVFFATPLGAQRVAREGSTSLAAAERGETTSSFDTRLYRWKTLLPEWEGSPIFGRGIGTTTTTEGTSANRLNGLLPHNEYIRYLVETGVVGILILLTGLAVLIRAMVLRLRIQRRAAAGSLGAPVLGIAVVVGCLVNSLADNTLLNSPTCYVAVLILAGVLNWPSAEPQRRPAPRPT